MYRFNTGVCVCVCIYSNPVHIYYECAVSHGLNCLCEQLLLSWVNESTMTGALYRENNLIKTINRIFDNLLYVTVHFYKFFYNIVIIFWQDKVICNLNTK